MPPDVDLRHFNLAQRGPVMETANDALLNGETAAKIAVVPDGKHPEHFLIVLDYGWAQTIVAQCDYTHHARGVALALAESLDCGHVEWPAEVGAA